MLLFSLLKGHVTNSAHRNTIAYVWSRMFTLKVTLYRALLNLLSIFFILQCKF
jgi:hypothetical protein